MTVQSKLFDLPYTPHPVCDIIDAVFVCDPDSRIFCGMLSNLILRKYWPACTFSLLQAVQCIVAWTLLIDTYKPGGRN